MSYTMNNASDDVSVDELSEFDVEYAQVKAAETAEVPDGPYDVRVNEVKLIRSRGDEPMLKWDLVILEGPHANRHIFKNTVITERSLSFIKADVKCLGVELPRLSSLPEFLGKFQGIALAVTRRTRDEYVNVYFNKRIDTSDTKASDAATGDGDVLPF